MYDDFPADNFTFPSPAIATASEFEPSSSSEGQFVNVEPPIRHSGIDQLQLFLSNEKTFQPSESSKPNVLKPQINRLGHSSAIEQLKQLVGSGDMD